MDCRPCVSLLCIFSTWSGFLSPGRSGRKMCDRQQYGWIFGSGDRYSQVLSRGTNTSLSPSNPLIPDPIDLKFRRKIGLGHMYDEMQPDFQLNLLGGHNTGHFRKIWTLVLLYWQAEVEVFILDCERTNGKDFERRFYGLTPSGGCRCVFRSMILIESSNSIRNQFRLE